MNQELALSLLKSWQNVFLTWQAWAGKTYVINHYIRWLRSCGIPVAITASTWIAATHIGGTTIHSRSGIGIKNDLSDHDLELIQQKEHLHKSMNAVKVLIIDEISMISATTLDMIDKVIQMMRRDGRPFGGLQVVLVGDFFQLPPVTSWQESNNAKRFAFASKAWKELDLAMCYLHTQHRQSEDAFWKLLNELRIWQASDESMNILRSRIHQDIAHTDPVKLYTHNIDVDAINDKQLEALTWDRQDYKTTGTWDKKLVAMVTKSMLAPELLSLKIGARVLFVKNNPSKWYYNGTTGEVVDFQIGTRYPRVKIANGNIITVEPEARSIENASEVVAQVKQIPLKLARAITIHKSQGMTLDAAEIDLSKVFEAGQWYVALSRLRSLESLKLLGLNEDGLTAHPLVVRGDKYFWEQSEILEKEYADRDDDMFEVLHERFVLVVGGSYTRELIELEKSLPTKKPKKTTGDTYKTTLDLIEQWKTLEEIAKIRDLTSSTILSHLFKIYQLYPETDLTAFKPEQTVLNLIQSVIDQAKKKGNTDEHGYVRLKTIYDGLNGKLGYGEIKRCMIFL